ncbi:MAG: hypothetical protein ACXVBH_11995, partial [Flavisolibacter sp.]
KKEWGSQFRVWNFGSCSFMICNLHCKVGGFTFGIGSHKQLFKKAGPNRFPQITSSEISFTLLYYSYTTVILQLYYSYTGAEI